jgi:hypothetical protein
MDTKYVYIFFSKWMQNKYCNMIVSWGWHLFVETSMSGFFAIYFLIYTIQLTSGFICFYSDFALEMRHRQGLLVLDIFLLWSGETRDWDGVQFYRRSIWFLQLVFMGSRFYNSKEDWISRGRNACKQWSKGTLTDHAAVLYKIRKWSYVSSVVSAQFRFTRHSI